MYQTAIVLLLTLWANGALAAAAVQKKITSKDSKTPPIERFTCRTGPNDEQARLIAEAVKGRVMEFAFYSRLGTRVCSIHGRRGDGVTKWEDVDAQAGATVIKLRSGSAQIEYKPGHVQLKFASVERMPYCGMYGDLNGMIEADVKKPECMLQGVFEDGLPKTTPPAKEAPGPTPGD